MISKQFIRAHDSDPPTKIAISRLVGQRCIHCGEMKARGIPIYYTILSTGKIIIWHNHLISDHD